MSDLNLTIALRGGPASIQKRRRGKCGRNERVVLVPMASILLQGYVAHPKDERARKEAVAAATRGPVVTDKQHGGAYALYRVKDRTKDRTHGRDSAARCTARRVVVTRSTRGTTSCRTKRHKSSTRSTAGASAGSDSSGDSSGHPPRSLRVERKALRREGVARAVPAGTSVVGGRA